MLGNVSQNESHLGTSSTSSIVLSIDHNEGDGMCYTDVSVTLRAHAMQLHADVWRKVSIGYHLSQRKRQKKLVF